MENLHKLRKKKMNGHGRMRASETSYMNKFYLVFSQTFKWAKKCKLKLTYRNGFRIHNQA